MRAEVQPTQIDIDIDQWINHSNHRRLVSYLQSIDNDDRRNDERRTTWGRRLVCLPRSRSHLPFLNPLIVLVDSVPNNWSSILVRHDKTLPLSNARGTVRKFATREFMLTRASHAYTRRALLYFSAMALYPMVLDSSNTCCVHVRRTVLSLSIDIYMLEQMFAFEPHFR